VGISVGIGVLKGILHLFSKDIVKDYAKEFVLLISMLFQRLLNLSHARWSNDNTKYYST